MGVGLSIEHLLVLKSHTLLCLIVGGGGELNGFDKNYRITESLKWGGVNIKWVGGNLALR